MSSGVWLGAATTISVGGPIVDGPPIPLMASSRTDRSGGGVTTEPPRPPPPPDELPPVPLMALTAPATLDAAPEMVPIKPLISSKRLKFDHRPGWRARPPMERVSLAGAGRVARGLVAAENASTVITMVSPAPGVTPV